MDATLAIVTLVSLALASAMGLITWRALSLERRREAARVAALVDLAADEIQIRADDRDSGGLAAHLFVEPERESPAGRRLVAIVAVAAIMAAGVGALFLARPVESGSSRTAVGSGSSRTLPGAPLELLSLRHEREADRLTITGLVKNPPRGAPLARVTAVAFVFDPQGTFVGSARAPLDFITLAPGDESPFVVTVTAPGRIGRYRVGFRADDGAVVGHVDRRAGPSPSS
jgi:hypothetical protein